MIQQTIPNLEFRILNFYNFKRAIRYFQAIEEKKIRGY